MRLKKLSIVGFKSFAEKISLDFDAAIMAIVGPNGCGKSNIVDAVRWAMGEQSARSLRGDKMHDVIFAGTDKRKALNFAEVSLTFSNEDHLIPLEYDEVTITRRLHRNGDSEYFINKNLSRLKDIYSLFWDSGLGKDAFSIFEQGKLDQVIHLSPLERRHIFDETAGIERFLQRKKEAGKKLDQVNENFLRAKDVHAEVQRQTKQLEKQAALAQKFCSIQENLIFLEQNIIYERYLNSQTRLNELSAKQKNHETKTKEFITAMNFLEQRLATTRQEMQALENNLRKSREDFIKIDTQITIKKAELLRIQQKDQDDKNRQQMLQKDYAELQEEAVKEKQLLEYTEKVFADLEVEVKKLQEQLAKLKIEQKNADSTLQSFKQAQQKLQVQQFESSQKLQQIKHQIKEHQIHLDNIAAKKSKIEEEKLNREEKIAILENECNSLRLQVKTTTSAIEKQQADLKKVEISLASANQAILAQKEIADKNQQELAENVARQKALMRLKDDFEGFSKGAKALLQEAKKPKSLLNGLIRPLSDLIVSVKGQEKRMAQILKPYLHTLVIKTNIDFATVIQYTIDKKIDDVSFICLEDIEQLDQPQTLNEASPLAVHFSKKILFDKDGFRDAYNVFFKWSDIPSESNTFLQEAELKILTQAIHKLQSAKNELETALIAAQVVRDQIQQNRIELDKQHRKGEIVLIQENFALQKTISEIDDLKKRGIAYSKDHELLEKEKQQRLLKIDELEKQVVLKEKSIAAQTLEMQTFEQQLEDLSIKQKVSAKNYYEINNQLQKLTAELTKHDQTKKVLLAKNEGRDKQIKKITDDLQQLNKILVALRGKNQDEHNDVGGLIVQQAIIQDQTKQIENELSKLKNVISKDDELLQTKKTAHSKTHTDTVKLEIQLSEATTRSQHLFAEFQTRYHLEITEFKNVQQLPGTIEEAEKIAKDLRQEIEKIGNVNMDSINAFEEQKKRYDFLNTQLEDLTATQKDIQDLISKLETDSRKIFKKTFERVRENFQKNFQILFKGGEADLKFTESQDILEAGIEIIAKPPGKQMRSITLLSGGEKCMTALALLFSIFEVKPAPFCILDEVDAPLDESNVDRFTEILKQFVDHTQFIIVTHNKKTMAVADVLFGVTMEEKGVSEVISLQFEKKTHPNLVTQL